MTVLPPLKVTPAPLPGPVKVTGTPLSGAPPAAGRTGAGRGVLYIAFAKFYFMLARLVIQLRLPARLRIAATPLRLVRPGD